mmetsp:Transcript_8885/g.14506  ORF Transcript_8885/g.14506 Transcript_8885/m.14506 type:complete len:207 (+) Transcript_8885:41-661(+)
MNGARGHIAIQHGADINQHGGIYINGKAYDYIKKMEVAEAYINAKAANEGRRPNIEALARNCKVNGHLITKIEKELKTHGWVLHPKEVYKNPEGPIGPGSKSIGETGAFVLYLLYSEEPSRILSKIILGVVVNESTVSRVFKTAFPYSAGLYRPNLVPNDKFRPANLEKAMEYLTFIALVDPRRVKFGDEKLLKGQELYNRNVRRF